jgi:hypothetical protein
MGIIFALALALITVPVMAQGGMGSSGGMDQLGYVGSGILESEGSVFQVPTESDVNYDSVSVGNDKATSFGTTWGWMNHYGPANAVNNLEIKKNQDSGICESCCTGDDACAECKDACLKVNVEQIKVGNRDVMAFGFANAANNVKIVTNQI